MFRIGPPIPEIERDVHLHRPKSTSFVRYTVSCIIILLYMYILLKVTGNIRRSADLCRTKHDQSIRGCDGEIFLEDGEDAGSVDRV